MMMRAFPSLGPAFSTMSLITNPAIYFAEKAAKKSSMTIILKNDNAIPLRRIWDTYEAADIEMFTEQLLERTSTFDEAE